MQPISAAAWRLAHGALNESWRYRLAEMAAINAQPRNYWRNAGVKACYNIGSQK